MYKRIKQPVIISRLFAIILSVLLCFGSFSVISYAAPEDENNDVEVEYIDLTDGNENNNEDNEDEVILDYDGQNIAVLNETEQIMEDQLFEELENNDKEDELNKATITTTTETTKTTSGNADTDDISQYAFTVDGKGTIRDLITDGSRTFYVIETADGSIYFLMAYMDNDVYNTYFLSEVDLNDIYEYLDSSSTSVESAEEEETTTEVVIEEEVQESSGSSSSGLIIVIIIIVIVVVVVLVYRNRNKSKKKSDNDEQPGMEEGNSQDVIDDNDWDDMDDEF